MDWKKKKIAQIADYVETLKPLYEKRLRLKNDVALLEKIFLKAICPFQVGESVLIEGKGQATITRVNLYELFFPTNNTPSDFPFSVGVRFDCNQQGDILSDKDIREDCKKHNINCLTSIEILEGQCSDHIQKLYSNWIKSRENLSALWDIIHDKKLLLANEACPFKVGERVEVPCAESSEKKHYLVVAPHACGLYTQLCSETALEEFTFYALAFRTIDSPFKLIQSRSFIDPFLGTYHPKDYYTAKFYERVNLRPEQHSPTWEEVAKELQARKA